MTGYASNRVTAQLPENQPGLVVSLKVWISICESRLDVFCYGGEKGARTLFIILPQRFSGIRAEEDSRGLAVALPRSQLRRARVGALAQREHGLGRGRTQ